MQEAWELFATQRAERDPGQTVTPREHGAPATSAAPDRDLPLLALDEGGDYEITGVLGEGGMGRVLLARQRSLGREVAIKVVKEDVSEQSTFGALFEEARITGSLEHPSIVPVHALGRDIAGRPVLVMKRVEGVSWSELLRAPDHPRWSSFGSDRLDANLDIAMAACNALHFAHSRGVVHRDVKLDNVMIGSFGEVYVVDWGIAIEAPKRGQRVPMVGTPTYMAPELVAGDLGRTTARTDVYLLGATLHHALVGVPRHVGDNLFAVLFAADASQAFPYGPEIPAELAGILNRATSRDPETRFESALALRRALADFRGHRGSIAIAEEARGRLAELARAIEEKADERRVHALMTESRFGFLQALQAWPANTAAREGLARCLELSIDHELSRGDLERARALMAELPAPIPALGERAEALARTREAERAEQEQLRSTVRDQDLRVGARAQLALLSMLPAFAVAMATYVATRHHELGIRELLGAPTVIGVAFGIAYLVMRHRLRTSVSRRAIAAILLLPLSALLHRLVGLRFHVSVAGMLGADLVSAAIFALLLGLTLVRPIAWLAAPLFVGALATIVRPELCIPITVGSFVSTLSLLVLAWRKAVR